MKASRILLLCLALPFAFHICMAQTKDERGCKDTPLIARFPGSIIYECEDKADNTFTFTDLGDKHEDKTIEGEYHYLWYNEPASASPSQVNRNLVTAFKTAGYTFLKNNGNGQFTVHMGKTWTPCCQSLRSMESSDRSSWQARWRWPTRDLVDELVIVLPAAERDTRRLTGMAGVEEEQRIARELLQASADLDRARRAARRQRDRPPSPRSRVVGHIIIIAAVFGDAMARQKHHANIALAHQPLEPGEPVDDGAVIGVLVGEQLHLDLAVEAVFRASARGEVARVLRGPVELVARPGP